MITFYTALGNLEVERRNGRKKPVVIKDGQRCDLSLYEFCLWTLLAWNFLNCDDLRRQYQQKRQELRLFDDAPFEYVLARLEERKLVASGMAYTAADAVCELVNRLRIRPIKVSSFSRFTAVIYLILRHGMTLRVAWRKRLPFRPDALQKRILALAGHVVMTTPEIIKCFEAGANRMDSEEQLIDTVYQEYTYENLHNDTRFSSLKDPVTAAVTSLYLNKQIIFE